MSGSFFFLSPPPFFLSHSLWETKKKTAAKSSYCFFQTTKQYTVIGILSHIIVQPFLLETVFLCAHCMKQQLACSFSAGFSPESYPQTKTPVSNTISVKETLMRHSPEPTLTHFSPSNRKTIESTHPHITYTHACVKMIETCPFLSFFLFILSFVCKEIIYYDNEYL